MSKIHNATCNAGIVTVNGKPVPGTVVLSEGLGQSEGVLIQDEKGLWYVPKASPDLNTTLEKLIAALGKTKDALDSTVAALTAIDTVAPLAVSTTGSASAQTGTATWVSVATSDISAISAAAGTIETLKGDLETLKGQLI